jgi:solute carrier family 5 (high affinity choline transporter), member 7
MVVHFKHHCNTYGSLSAYIVAFLVRLSGGEPILGLSAFIHFPGYDYETEEQLFPFRTMAMLMSLITLAGVSWLSKYESKIFQKYYQRLKLYHYCLDGFS